MTVQSNSPEEAPVGSSHARPHDRPHGRAHELGFDLPAPTKISKAWAVFAVVGAAVVLGAAFAVGYVPRHRERLALEEAAQGVAGAAMRVSVIAPKIGSSDRAVVLPGSVQPLQETVLYARASGFVRRWLVDMGDKVTEGQLLAEIETPELDQELEQARAVLAQAQPTLARSKANRELSGANLKRYQQLTPVGVASQADLDQRQAQAQVDEANVSVAQATIDAQQANIRRLTQLKAFARVTAPFAGTVTQRWVEIGALVTAGNGQPLYRVAALDPARVFVQVPQDVAPGVRADLPATVLVREYPGRSFQGKVARSAGELDSATRTMNTEVRVPNGDGALIAGMYAQVALTLPSPHRVFELPATALMSDANGLRVATVDDDSKIHLIPVVVERDTGTSIELSSGLTGGERVVKLASAEFVEGGPVDVVP
ncbi:MAG TPA: efflux RND transporter periplasmic adaptor subunit [Polyangiaceae bacterium]